MLFNELIYFHGKYRPYQQRILDRFAVLENKKKIHIVAAPGSGKTTLGIELILRVNQPCLILTPSITIREQWISSFKKDFLDSSLNIDDYISNDLNRYAPIICITYQALYSAYKKYKHNDEDDQEIIDFSSFDLNHTLIKYKIGTICLDECHHLRNEWWKVLESVVKKINNVTLISLTATPPYDSSLLEWKRYINLCGPIDEEIFVPELLKERNLCPHQDFVYLCELTDKDATTIKRFHDNAIKVYEKYSRDPTLLSVVMENNAYKKYGYFKQKYYHKADYYRALILFLNHNRIKIPALIRYSCKIEPFNIAFFETLLQYLLFDDIKSYQNQDFLNRLKKELIALRLINDGKVNLLTDERHAKLFAENQNKLNAIVDIINHEYNQLKEQLRLLILADYIKKETKSAINNENKELSSIGIVPIFETIRRQNNKNIKICLISGSLSIVHQSCIEPLKNIVEFSNELRFKEINHSSYYEITIPTIYQKELVKALTHLFEQGVFQVVIGTKALLGEGWDAPCVNTLILSSVSGAYISSNQTRGRAIRTDKNNPNKVSNIWHLASVYDGEYPVNMDFIQLQKRFNTFLGLDIESNQIENGLNRIIKQEKYTLEEAKLHNQKMLEISSFRSKIKQRWEYCILHAKDLENIKNELILDKNYFKYTYSFYNTLVQVILVSFLFYNIYETFSILTLRKFLPLLGYIVSFVALGSYFIFLIIRLFKLINKKQKLKYIANAMLDALKDIQVIKSDKIDIGITKYKRQFGIYLKNATTYEQNVFLSSFLQLFEYPDSPKYLLCRPKSILWKEYYVVPDIFKKNKESAMIFAKRMNHSFGRHKLYFTKSHNVKGIVLQTRTVYMLRYKKMWFTQKRSIYMKKN